MIRSTHGILLSEYFQQRERRVLPPLRAARGRVGEGAEGPKNGYAGTRHCSGRLAGWFL